MKRTLTLWEMGLKVLEKETEKTNKNQVAQRLKVNASTVGRWLAGERGEDRPIAKYLDQIFQEFSDAFEEVMMENYDAETASLLIELKNQGKLEEAKKALRLLTQDDDRAKKLLNEVDYLNRQ